MSDIDRRHESTQAEARERSAARVVLKPEAVALLRRLAGTSSEIEFAETIGVDAAALALASSGLTSPSTGLLARIIVAFPQVSLSSLCAVA